MNLLAENLRRMRLEKFPDSGLLHLYAGDACRALKRYEEAFRHWQEAVQIAPEMIDATFSMAFCREELGQMDQAATLWEEIAQRLMAMGMKVEAQFPHNMAEKCRARLFA